MQGILGPERRREGGKKKRLRRRTASPLLATLVTVAGDFLLLADHFVETLKAVRQAVPDNGTGGLHVEQLGWPQLPQAQALLHLQKKEKNAR